MASTSTNDPLRKMPLIELLHMREAGRVMRKYGLPLTDPETGQPITEAVDDEIKRRYPDRNASFF